MTQDTSFVWSEHSICFSVNLKCWLLVLERLHFLQWEQLALPILKRASPENWYASAEEKTGNVSLNLQPQRRGYVHHHPGTKILSRRNWSTFASFVLPCKISLSQPYLPTAGLCSSALPVQILLRFHAQSSPVLSLIHSSSMFSFPFCFHWASFSPLLVFVFSSPLSLLVKAAEIIPYLSLSLTCCNASG